MQNQPYEFDQSQNWLIHELAEKMRFVSYFLIALGVLFILLGITSLKTGDFGSAGSAVQGILQIVVGIWTKQAATSFQLIVNTQGGDIQNLMGALGELRKLYTLQYWIFLIAVVLVIIAIVLTLIIGTFSLGS